MTSARDAPKEEVALASSSSSSWVIELERGWGPWTPGDSAFTGEASTEPFRYRLGRHEFEAHFISDSEGTQTNLSTGKVRRIARVSPGQEPPSWEASGCRRRPAHGQGPVGTEVFAAGKVVPKTSAAYSAQASRDARRSPSGVVEVKLPAKSAVSRGSFAKAGAVSGDAAIARAVPALLPQQPFARVSISKKDAGFGTSIRSTGAGYAANAVAVKAGSGGKSAKSGGGCTCRTAGCNKPTWNGKGGEKCSKGCGFVGSICITSGCDKASWNGKAGQKCSESCQEAPMYYGKESIPWSPQGTMDAEVEFLARQRELLEAAESPTADDDTAVALANIQEARAKIAQAEMIGGDDRDEALQTIEEARERIAQIEMLTGVGNFQPIQTMEEVRAKIGQANEQ